MGNRKRSHHTFYMLRWLFSRTPLYVLQYFCYALCTQLISVVANVLMLKHILEIIISDVNKIRILYVVAAFCVYILVTEWYRSYFKEQIQKKNQEKLAVILQKEVYDKAKAIDMIVYEKPDFYRQFLLATDDVENQIDKFLASLANFFAGCCNVIMTGAIFLSIDAGVLLAAIGITLITIALDKPIIKWKTNKKVIQKEHTKKELYYYNCFYLKEYSKELRISRLSELLIDYDGKNCDKYLEEVKKPNRSLFGYGFLQQVISEQLLMNFLLCGYLAYKVLVIRTMDIAGFTAVFTGSNELVGGLINISSYLSEIRENEIFIRHFRMFYEYRPAEQNESVQNEQEPFRELSIRNLHFSYPQSSKEILSGIDMDIRTHQKIALVGRNGCGKTTLVMNLLRFYPASCGEIYLNGREGKMYCQEDYRRYFMALFQDFTMFAVSVAENISMDTEWDENRVREALNSVGLERLSSDLQSDIFSEFDKNGVVLSGGQMQRLALGRVIYSDSEILVLDEPSAALDALAEEQLNRMIEAAAIDKTVIFISHRLTSVCMADIIYVMDGGKIAEYGTHEELLKKHSLYELMWKIQTSNY